ncbi:MAG: hypothetical protein QF552_09790 [Litorilituus sp.]|jgi:septal ring factor EnvC (AmiA/AmiB activator)|nr:hypothetical protein [Litorilituus sp.]
MFSLLQQKYRRLPAKEKKQLFILIACVVISAYGFYATMLWQDMFQAEKLANRKANRIETRIGKIQEPKFDSNLTDKKLKTLQQQLKQSEEAIAQLTEKFIPLNDADALQKLKLDIAELADKMELKITNFEVLGVALKAHEEELTEYNDTRRQYYKRPSFAIEAQSQFYPLLNFIKALNQLDNLAIVKKINIIRTEQGKLTLSMTILV